MNTRIVVNGQTLLAGKDKPVELQRQLDELARSLAEQNANPVSGVLEGSDRTAVQMATAQQFIINGRRYSSIDEMPPAERKLFEQMRGMLIDQAFGKAQPAGQATANVAGESTANRATALQPIAYLNAPTFLSPGREASDLAWLVQLFLLLLGITIGLAVAVAIWFALK